MRVENISDHPVVKALPDDLRKTFLSMVDGYRADHINNLVFTVRDGTSKWEIKFDLVYGNTEEYLEYVWNVDGYYWKNQLRIVTAHVEPEEK